MRRLPALLALLALPTLFAACGDHTILRPVQSTGSYPQLPKPFTPVIPTVNIATARTWPDGAAPVPAQAGLTVTAFAGDLAHPRSLLVLPNGDVLVAETSSPGPDRGYEDRSVRGALMYTLMSRAGANVPSANRIMLLRDADGDGVAETRVPYITQGLNSPFGMALIGDTLYVANANALVAYPYDPDATSIETAPRAVTWLPAQRNHHWTKSLAAGPDGMLYVGVGSNSNRGEHGLNEERERAAIWRVDPQTGRHAIYASGLRNPAAIAVMPGSNQLYAAVNERDELGSDLVPDYLTRVQEDGFYGWPWSYYGGHVDTRVRPRRMSMVRRALTPDYALGAHVAPLGIAFSHGQRLGPAYANGIFVGLHGSWNSRPLAGYKVVFVRLENGRPVGDPQDVLGGFVTPDQQRALGRPVGVAIARDGALLVADDVGGRVWRVSAAR
jgi:glucose/arabinose dehydrogenase